MNAPSPLVAVNMALPREAVNDGDVPEFPNFIVGPPRAFQSGEAIPPRIPPHDVLLAAHHTYHTAANKAYATMNVTRSLHPAVVDVHRDIKLPLRELLKKDISEDIPVPTFWIGADKVADNGHWAQMHHVKPKPIRSFTIGKNYDRVYTVYEVTDFGVRLDNKNGNRRPRGYLEMAMDKIPEAVGVDPTKTVEDSGMSVGSARTVGSTSLNTVSMTGIESAVANMSQCSSLLSSLGTFSHSAVSTTAPVKAAFAEDACSSLNGMISNSSLDDMISNSSLNDMIILASYTKKLSINNEIFDCIDTACLANLLAKDCATLRQLRFYCCTIPSSDFVSIAEALKKNSSLLQLRLSHNAVGNDGAVAIAHALARNTALQEVDLSVNNIGNVGAIAMAKALETNSTLESLDLGWNNIGDEGAVAFGKALEVNTALKELHLGSIKMSKYGAVAIAAGLEKNTASALVKLYLWDNGIDMKVFAKAREVNTKLVVM